MLVYDNLKCIYTLNMEAESSSETFVRTYQTIQYHKPEDPCSSSVCLFFCIMCIFQVVGLCHHGMARPQVADRGKASDMEGS